MRYATEPQRPCPHNERDRARCGRQCRGEGGLGRRSAQREGGFTLVEFMIAVAIMAAVLSGTMLMASQIQQAYSTDLDEVLVEQEVRFALDWITRVLRSAGSNPYGIETSTCASVVFQTVDVDPSANGGVDEIQIHADITGPGGSPDGLLGGSAGSCNQAGEDVRIFYNAGTGTIRIQDQNTDATALDMTEPVITGLQFVYYNASHTVLCGDPCATPANIDPDLVAYVTVRVTGQSTAYDTNLGDRATTTLESEVRIRTR